MTDDLSRRIANHDWDRSYRSVEPMVLGVKGDPKPQHFIWELLIDAAKTAQQAYGGTPRQGFPSKSAMPDAPDEISGFMMMRAYLAGEIEDAPAASYTPPRPDAAQVDRADLILEILHRRSLIGRKDRVTLNKAVHAKALGIRTAAIQRETGMDRKQLSRAKKLVLDDMWKAIEGRGR